MDSINLNPDIITEITTTTIESDIAKLRKFKTKSAKFSKLVLFKISKSMNIIAIITD
jgi:hypothetical protein